MQRLAKIIDFYPAIGGLCFVCLGIVTSFLFRSDVLYWSLPAWVISLAFIPVAARRVSRSIQWAAVGTLLFFTGFNATLESSAVRDEFTLPSDRRIVHATVKKELASGTGFRVLLVDSGTDVSSKRGLPGSGRLFLRNNSALLCAGDRIGFKAFLRKPTNRKNPGEFNWEIYCRNHGIMWLASVQGRDSILVIRRGWKYRPGALLFRFRESMKRFMERRWTGDVRAVAKGVVLGDRGEISPGLRRKFADSGLAHMLSASGLHVGIVSLLALPLVSGLTRFCPSVLLYLPFRKLSALFSIPLMLTYCFLVGARIPSVRATIMGLVVAAAILADRRWHSLNSLGVAGLIIVLLFPLSLFTVSFQLSFLAVLGILATVPQLTDRLHKAESRPTDDGYPPEKRDAFSRLRQRIKRAYPTLVGILFTPMAAQASVAPLVLYVFHSFPTYSLAANLATSLMLTLALPLAFIGSVVGVLSTTAGFWLSAPAGVLFQSIVDIAGIYSSLPRSTLSPPPTGMAGLTAAILAATCFLWFLRTPSLRRLLGLGMAVTMIFVAFFCARWFWAEDTLLQATFLNVGHADAAFIRLPGARGILVDAGARTLHFDAGTSIVGPFLKNTGVRSLDGVVISHPQMDHVGGLLTVIPRFPPKQLWLNRVAVKSAFQDRIIVRAKERGASIIQADRNLGPVSLGKARLRFLNPPGLTGQRAGVSADLNNSSVVFRLEYGNVSFLFTGDLEHEGERELLQSRMPLAATVLKVGHHGCGSSSSAEFLQAVRPRIAVISCSRTRASACPGDEVLVRLRALGAHILWTGRDGGIIIETNGQKLRARTGSSRRYTFSLADQIDR